MSKNQTGNKLKPDDLRAVRANIELIREFCAPGMSQDKIRLAAPSLRLLVTNDGLGKAWRTVGHEKSPTIISDGYSDIGHTFFGAAITASDTEPQAEYSNPYGPSMMWAMTPDGELKEVPLQRVGGAIFLHGTQSFANDIHEGNSLGWTPDSPLNLESFRVGCIIKFGDLLISRNKVIKYIANTRGAAHLYSEKQSNKAEKAAYDALDQISEGHHTFDRDTVFAALMTIGQHLTASDDVKCLEKEIASVLPHDPRRR